MPKSDEEIEFENAFISFKKATLEYYTARLNTMKSENRVKRLWWEGIVEGTIAGKNEKEREASLYSLFPDLVSGLDVTREGELLARVKYEVAKLEYRYRYTILTGSSEYQSEDG